MDALHPGLNRFTSALRDFCAGRVTEEKWLVAPSLRVGQQWLDAVVRSGQPLLNVRLTTVPGLALALAAPAMERDGLRLLRGVALEVMIGRLWQAMREEGGYLGRLPHGRGLVEALVETVKDLRLAGVEAASFRARACESRLKGEELRELLRRYECALEEEGLADPARVLRLAARALRAGGLREGVLVIAPESSGEERALELELWQAIPEAARWRLPVDRPGEAGAAAAGGLFRAVGEANELREVLRRCVEHKIPFDEVEILYTDSAVYPPLAFELASAADPDRPWLTIADGLPVRTFRPGRALLCWVEWVRGGFPQAVLARMVGDGLLELPAAKGPSFARLAALLRAAPIGSGRDRYLPALALSIAAARAAVRTPEDPDHPDRSRSARRRAAARLRGLKQLRRLVRGLLQGAPRPESTGTEILVAALTLVEKRVRAASELDGYARRSLVRALQERLEAGPAAAAEAWDWLARLPAAARVGGEGPRPGCLYLSSLRSGGHAGRRHTFIVGLDDSRFPGAGLQDPLLLDGERRALCATLPTAAERMARQRTALDGLLARLRGTVTLSYPCRSLHDDRELHPSSALLDHYRSLTGDIGGDQAAFAKQLGPPAAFASQSEGRCIDPTEWWLWRLCAGPGRVLQPEQVLAASFPCLGRGLVARAARASDRFTIYDGFVPEAGRDLELMAGGAPVLSASRLEKLGTCPQEYFFQHVLGLELPEEYGAREEEWLGPLGRGAVLHEVFFRFMRELGEAQLPADYQRDSPRLLAILDEQVSLAAQQIPPPNQPVYRREIEEMRETARIFLHEEEAQAHAGVASPFCFEVAVGMRPEGRGSPLDCEEPLAIWLGVRGCLRVRGRIDRVDRLAADEQRFAVWDYKTGSASKYDEASPFRGGRQVQGTIYLAMADAVLQRSVSPAARASSFGYFFPAAREHGRRIAWSARELEAGPRVLELLWQLLRAGVFPFSDEASDAQYSDYRHAFGDLDAAAAAARAKLDQPANQVLEPFRELRRHA